MIKFMEWVLKLVGIEVETVGHASEDRIARVTMTRSEYQVRKEWTGR